MTSAMRQELQDETVWKEMCVKLVKMVQVDWGWAWLPRSKPERCGLLPYQCTEHIGVGAAWLGHWMIFLLYSCECIVNHQSGRHRATSPDSSSSISYLIV